jgi:hypothetical protein
VDVFLEFSIKQKGECTQDYQKEQHVDSQALSLKTTGLANLVQEIRQIIDGYIELFWRQATTALFDK